MLSPIFESFLDDRSRSGNDDMCVNLYPEHIDGPKGQEIGMLINTPGLTSPLVAIGTGPIRGMHPASDGQMYVVSGNTLFLVNSYWNWEPLGTLTTATGPVSIVDGISQILVVDGVGGWIWSLTANTWTQVIPNSNTSDVGPSIAVYQDGFALVNDAYDNQIYQSNYNDLSLFATPIGGGGYTANNAYVQRTANPIVTMYDIKGEVWIFKKTDIEVWINQGASGFAFTPLQGVAIPVGCVAPASIVRLGDGLAWLGASEQGGGVVYMSVGYQVKPITSFALASLFQGFPIISDAIAYSYQQDGHYFYVLTFPNQNVTFCFDLSTGKWHQRGAWSNGSFNREIPNCHAYFANTHVVGDYRNGNIYALSDAAYTDNGAPRKWLRSWSALPSNVPQGAPMSFDSLQILLETGITVASDANPQIMLRWSDDSGYTWIGSVLIPAGKIGQTSWRVIQNRLGSTKIGTGLNRVWEISGVDPIAIKITGASWEGGPS